VDPDYDLKYVEGEVLVDPDYDLKYVEGEALVDLDYNLKCVEGVVEEDHLAMHFDERQGEAVDLGFDIEHVVELVESHLTIDFQERQGELVDLEEAVQMVDSDLDLEHVEGVVEEVHLAMYSEKR
jgi:hypothetical protein